MSWAVANSNLTGALATSGGVTSTFATFANSVTAGDLIAAGCSNYSVGFSNVKDSANSTNYTQAGSTFVGGSGNDEVGIFFFVAPIGGSSFKVTLTVPSGSYPGLGIGEFSYPSLASVASDGTGTATSASGGTLTTGAITVTGTDLIVANCYSESGTSPTSAMSTMFVQQSGSVAAVASFYLLNQSTNYTASIVTATPAGAAMIAAALKPTTSGGGGSTLVIGPFPAIPGGLIIF